QVCANQADVSSNLFPALPRLGVSAGEREERFRVARLLAQVGGEQRERGGGVFLIQFFKRLVDGAAGPEADLVFEARRDQLLLDAAVVNDHGHDGAECEAADVRPEGYSTLHAERTGERAKQQLLREPEGQHDVSRDFARAVNRAEQEKVEVKEPDPRLEV